ncbi:carbohydrate kinase family protein [Microbacterium sp. HJ5]
MVGAIAWDTVVHVDTYPAPGGFTRGARKIERPGGSAANVAQALASSGVEVGFVTVLGRDDRGQRLHQTLLDSDVAHLEIQWVEGESEHVIVLVHDDGDRTILGLTPDRSAEIDLSQVPLRPEDLVVFVVWDRRYLAALELAQAAGCTTIVGLGAVEDPRVRHADIAFGSHADIRPDTDLTAALHRFDRIVMTHGARGARQHDPEHSLTQEAAPAKVVDTTGAGDAFLAGYLAAYARGLTDGRVGLQAGARWAAAMVQTESSIPPACGAVSGIEEILSPEPVR